ncbi:MAG: hypothetical protein PVI19_01570 [Syntrophobacterales bacterium]
MKGTFKKLLPLLLVGLGVGALVLGLKPWLFSTTAPVSETPVKVTEIQWSEQGEWIVPRDAVAEISTSTESYVLRLKHFRTQRLPVTVVNETGDGILLHSDKLNPGDLLVMEPASIKSPQAVAPTEGVDDETLIYLTLEAGMAAAMAEDLDESVRFVSPDYRDSLGFNFALMRRLLERAYEKFNEPRIELTQPTTIQVKDNQAMVQAKITVTAIYQDRRNYLLGEQENPDSVLVVMNKSANGWKVSRIEGLRPLGFEENFLKLLGAQIGLPLTDAESLEKKQFCMPCRQRMAERFGLKR